MDRKRMAAWTARLLALLLGLAPLAALAEVTRFEVLSVQRPALEGRGFGKVGQYEKITARVTVALDPRDRRNAGIADIALAPRNGQGKVEAIADVVVMRPADPTKGSGTLFYEVVNRGRKLGLGLFDAAGNGASRLEKAADAGDGYLFDQGYTLVWSGWQADFTPGAGELGIEVPMLKGVTGPAREEFIFDNAKAPAVGTLTWPSADPAGASLTVRAKAGDPRQMPADLSFRLVDPTHVEITRPAGFDAGALYEFRYTARDPKVLGLGFAATRDLIAFLRHDRTGANPLAIKGIPTVRRAYGYGSSQSGRFLREFLYLGFNQDLAGRRVFEAMLPHIAGARMTAVNARFGLPGRNSRHAQDPAWQADRFPFTYAETTDPFTGVRDSLMARCRRTSTCPKVIQADSEHEWWASRASLLVTDPEGRPLALPADVRAFLVTGTPHVNAIDAAMKTSDQCQMPLNPLHQGPVLRALLGALDDWTARGVAPPPSRTPNLADGSLVKADARQPAAPIPGLPYTGMHTGAWLMDQSKFPPSPVGEYVVYVPRIDQDGMVAGGVRMPVIQAPLATYTGWNPHAAGYGETTFCPLLGGAVPLAKTRAERTARGDPRRSVEERYPTSGAYVAAVQSAADRLVKARLMLPRDAPGQVQAALEDRLSHLHPDSAAKSKEAAR
jgi:hypothetical protein